MTCLLEVSDGDSDRHSGDMVDYTLLLKLSIEKVKKAKKPCQ